MRAQPPLHQFADIAQAMHGDQTKIDEAKTFLINFLIHLRGSGEPITYRMVCILCYMLQFRFLMTKDKYFHAEHTILSVIRFELEKGLRLFCLSVFFFHFLILCFFKFDAIASNHN